MSTIHAAPFDSKSFRNACGRFATGITIVTTELDGEVHGMTANGFMSVSLDPALILISVAHHTNMHQLLQQTQKYAVSILNGDQEMWSSHFAGWHQENLEVTFDRIADSPVVPNAIAQFVTEMFAQHEAGDHTLYLGRVTHFTYQEEGAPILFYTGQYKQMQS